MEQAGPLPSSNTEREDLVKRHVEEFLEQVAAADKDVLLIQIDPDKTPDRLGFGKEMKYMDMMRQVIKEKNLFEEYTVIVAPAFLSIKTISKETKS